MSFRRSRYFLGEAFRSLIHNRLMSIASILTVASCLLIVSVFYTLAVNIDFFLRQLEGNIGITVFIYNDVDAEGVETLYDQFREIEHIHSLLFISHQRAFETVKALYEDPSILDGIPPENFPRSFNIGITELRYHDTVVTQLEALTHMGIYRIRQDQNITRMVITISNMVRWVSSVLILILAGVSIIIITNTIRITVNARQAEINIMKYVGATDWFIRWPFLIEGILIGILGSSIPVIAIWTGYSRVIVMVQEGMPLIEFIEFRAGHEIFALLFPFVIFLGAFIGAIGSGMSIRKHLHV